MRWTRVQAQAFFIAASVLLATAGVAAAKTLRIRPPDFTSDAYWDGHAVYVIRVTGVERSGEPRGSLVRYEVVVRISHGPHEETGSVPAAALRPWTCEGATNPSKPRPGDYWLLLEPTTGHEPTAARPVGAPAADPLVQSLEHIAKLRTPSEPDNLLAVARSSDDLVAQYALRRLLGDPTATAAPAEVSGLRALADNVGHSAACRVLSYRAAAHLAGEPDASDAEYGWLQAAVKRTVADDPQQLEPFVDRMLSLAERRPETAAFLTALAEDANVSAAARAAAYDAFVDPRLFNFRTSDDVSRLVFQTCIDLLHDPQPAVRTAAAQALYDLARQVDQSAKAAWTAEGRRALLTAVQAEKDPATKKLLSAYYEGLGPHG